MKDFMNCPNCNNNLYIINYKYYDEFQCDCTYTKCMAPLCHLNNNKDYLLSESIYLNNIHFYNDYQKYYGYISCQKLFIQKLPIIKDLQFFNKEALIKKSNNILLFV